MNPKQEAFAREYVVDSNATQAAIRAGYSPKTAYAQGSRLLTYVEVRAAVQQQREQRALDVELTADVVLSGLLDIALHGNVDSARVRAFELLGKHLSLFTDRLEVTQVPDASLVRSWIDSLEADIASNT